MNEALFQQLLDGDIEFDDIPKDLNMELTDNQKHEMRLWLVAVYGFSYEVAKGYIR